MSTTAAVAGPLKQALEILGDQQQPSRCLDESLLSSVFEPAIEAMASGVAPYSSEVVLATLKLYELHPLALNFDCATTILLLAMMHPERPESPLLLHSIPPNFYMSAVTSDPATGETKVAKPISEGIQAVVQLDRHLRQCEYLQFWKKVNHDPPSAACTRKLPDFRPAIRNIIAKSIVSSHKRITEGVACQMLDLKPQADRELVLQLLTQAAAASKTHHTKTNQHQPTGWAFDTQATAFYCTN